MTENTVMVLDDVQKAFVEQWGEMGARWGVSRSVAAVHAFLYLSEEALTADDLCEALSMARSNVSTALKELEGWELVFRESRVGDRKSYYRVQSDVWEMARAIMKERKRREADGALRAVGECLDKARRARNPFQEKRLEAMQEILQLSCAFADKAVVWPSSLMKKALRMGDKILGWIAGK
ncbi:GbsR/MarR family transcriptional regulator [Akkermansia sp.]|uniref:GbsR/MarR family transcriptional regulator n=2 Tax=Akkermansia sp. TaxID=1872421 RepID=UPI00262833DC|nr:MarR family transcriptional regulator [uncultured Akkermansia sp.]MCD8272129.1 MarR family transcriptional regulator [Akkermansia sp.]